MIMTATRGAETGADAGMRFRDTGAFIGAAAGTLAFLVGGVVPGLVYGGYMGVLLGATATGGALAAGPATSAVILAGMGAGVLCTWSVFIVTGAAIGAIAGWMAETGPEVGEHVPAR